VTLEELEASDVELHCKMQAMLRRHWWTMAGFLALDVGMVAFFAYRVIDTAGTWLAWLNLFSVITSAIAGHFALKSMQRTVREAKRDRWQFQHRARLREIGESAPHHHEFKRRVRELMEETGFPG